MRTPILVSTIIIVLCLWSTAQAKDRTTGPTVRANQGNQSAANNTAIPPQAGGGAQPKNDRHVFLVPVGQETSWQEFAYLAAIPAARKINKYEPSVIALDAYGQITPELGNYLKRYEPAVTYLLGKEAEWSQGHWALDEGTGNTVQDRSGFGYNGLIQGAAWVNGDLTFDGIDDHVVMTGCKGILGSSGRTSAAWIKTTEKDGEIMAWGLHGAPGACWVMGLDDRGALSLYAGDALARGSSVLSDGKWHHVAAVLDSQSLSVIGNVKFYVDGEVESISQVWDGASGTLKNNLIGYWRMEEGTGTTLLDSSQGGNSGTFHTDFSAGGDYPDWGPGVLGTGLYFDNNDYIEIANEAYFDGTAAAFTVSCWVKHHWAWGVGGNDQFVTKGNKHQTGWELGRAYDSTSGKLSANKTDVESNAVAPVDVWHHVVGVYNGNVLAYYVDGIKRDQKVVGAVGQSDTSLYLGCGSYGGSPSSSGPASGRYKGWLDEVAVWDRALTDDEIEDLFNNGSGMVIDTTSTILDTQAGNDLKLGMFDGTYLYYNGAIKDARIYDRGLSQEEVVSLKNHDSQSYDAFTPLPSGSLDEAACALAGTFWIDPLRIVLCDENDYEKALSASALAANLEAPLLYFDGGAGLSSNALSTIAGLAPAYALLVGDNATVASQLSGLGISTQSLMDASAVIQWMVQNGMPPDYLAAVNPLDRHTGRVHKSAVAGALLAAGRHGAVAPLPFDTVWKQPFWYDEAVDRAPPGAPTCVTDIWYLGSFCLDADTYDFVLSSNQDAYYYNRVNIDFNHNGDFGDPGEGPFESADPMEIEGKTYAVSISMSEFATPGHIKFTYPCADEMKEVLADYYAVLGGHPEYLCVIGLPEVIPFGLANGYYAYADVEDVPSDAFLADADDDPFYEIAVGRVFGENLHYATLLAARSLTYQDLIKNPDIWAMRPMWTGQFWDMQFPMPHKLDNVGYYPTVIHAHDPGYDKTRLGIVIQDDHGGPGGIGGGWGCETEELLAPCVLDAGGCDSAGIDMVPLSVSGSVNLLRKGAAAYIGTQRGTPEDKRVYRQDLWNAILTGATLGQGHRHGLNSMKVSYFDAWQPPVYMDYCLHSEAFYGDPALKIFVPGKPVIEPAHVEASGNILTAVAPEEYWFDHIPSGDYEGFYYCGAGMHPDYDGDIRFLYAVWTTGQQVTNLTQDPATPTPLGWPTKKWYIDEHQDGTRSLYWKVRFLDFDRDTGNVLKERDRIKYTVTF